MSTFLLTTHCSFWENVSYFYPFYSMSTSNVWFTAKLSFMRRVDFNPQCYYYFLLRSPLHARSQKSSTQKFSFFSYLTDKQTDTQTDEQANLAGSNGEFPVLVIVPHSRVWYVQFVLERLSLQADSRGDRMTLDTLALRYDVERE